MKIPRTCRGVLPRSLHYGVRKRYNAFTLIELIVVVGIIAILSALVLSTVGYARKKAARARAETEIAAMSAACENYKADNGVYPETTATATDADSRCSSRQWKSVRHDLSRLRSLGNLYALLSRRHELSNRSPTRARVYMAFKPNMLLPAADRNRQSSPRLQIHLETAMAIRRHNQLIQTAPRVTIQRSTSGALLA